MTRVSSEEEKELTVAVTGFSMLRIETDAYSALAHVALLSTSLMRSARFASAEGFSSRSPIPQVNPCDCRKCVHSRLNILNRLPAITLPYSSCKKIKCLERHIHYHRVLYLGSLSEVRSLSNFCNLSVFCIVFCC